MPRAMSTAISGMSASSPSSMWMKRRTLAISSPVGATSKSTPLEKNQVEQTGGERREGGGEEEIVQVRDRRLAMAATP